jgi:hypothetical protein
MKLRPSFDIALAGLNTATSSKGKRRWPERKIEDMDLIETLECLIGRAKHKPGQWYESDCQSGAISSLSETKKQEPGIVGEVKALFIATGIFARDFESPHDVRLAVAAINALPELLALAKDGLKYRADKSAKD